MERGAIRYMGNEWDWYVNEQQEKCRSKGMEYVSGHFRYKNGKKVAYVSSHCRKRRR